MFLKVVQDKKVCQGDLSIILLRSTLALQEFIVSVYEGGRVDVRSQMVASHW